MKPGVGLIGRKLGMTQVFEPDGRPVPVTVLEAGPCAVVQEKTLEKDGYRAVQVGFGEADAKELTKPLAGHFAKRQAPPRHVLREFRLGKDDQAALGSTVTVEMFKAGDRVDVTGRSIGKGFAGGPKRWHWKGGDQTHGSMTHRRPGSIGSSTDPSRVFKGHHMPGHMGDRTVTTQAMVVVRVDAGRNLLMLKGSVPGSDEALVVIRKSRKPPKLARPAPQPKKKAAAQPAGRKPAAGKTAAKPAAAPIAGAKKKA
ncbi:MAG: 50S ribosomal protein L3 [Candidatus Omnitrophica bacterium]|nr:50S ribosomal protein L3 [Candidatus Omnitrophota bacterium]